MWRGLWRTYSSQEPRFSYAWWGDLFHGRSCGSSRMAIGRTHSAASARRGSVAKERCKFNIFPCKQSLVCLRLSSG